MSTDRLSDDEVARVADAPYVSSTRDLAREVRDLRAETAALRTLLRRLDSGAVKCDQQVLGHGGVWRRWSPTPGHPWHGQWKPLDAELAAVLDRTLEGDD